MHEPGRIRARRQDDHHSVAAVLVIARVVADPGDVERGLQRRVERGAQMMLHPVSARPLTEPGDVADENGAEPGWPSGFGCEIGRHGPKLPGGVDAHNLLPATTDAARGTLTSAIVRIMHAMRFALC